MISFIASSYSAAPPQKKKKMTWAHGFPVRVVMGDLWPAETDDQGRRRQTDRAPSRTAISTTGPLLTAATTFWVASIATTKKI